MYIPPEFFVFSASILTIIFLRKLLSADPLPICNIYRIPGPFYYFKVYFIYILMNLRKLKRSKVNYEDLDKAQPLSDSEKPIDAVYFNCSNSSNECLIVGMARRKNKQIDGFMFLRIEELGLLKSSKVPDTTLWQQEDEDGTFNAEGISLTPVVPVEEWDITYDGQMLDKEGKVHDVKVNAQWISQKEIFNFETDIDTYLMATSIAREKWSRSYFDLLKKKHQTHYEQCGEIVGSATVDGKTYQFNHLSGMRDHSFGHKRDWNDLNRYAFHFVTTENGDQLAIAIVSMPICFSVLYFGYMYKGHNKKAYPLQECDFQLYQHGESGTPPTDYAFTFKAGGETYTLEVNVVDQSEFFISKDWESKVMELVCNYKLNGVKGWGVSEWEYRNIKGKNDMENH